MRSFEQFWHIYTHSRMRVVWGRQAVLSIAVKCSIVCNLTVLSVPHLPVSQSYGRSKSMNTLTLNEPRNIEEFTKIQFGYFLI